MVALVMIACVDAAASFSCENVGSQEVLVRVKNGIMKGARVTIQNGRISSSFL